MNRVVAALILAFAIALVSHPALAHRPYYTMISKIRLADGTVGEVRLLNGDGILGPDPVRPVLLDSHNRLIARGPKSYSLVIVCKQDYACTIVDPIEDRVFELDAATFRAGPEQPSVDEWDRTDDWDLEDGTESWGFAQRDAAASEILQAHYVLARRYAVLLLFLAGMMAVGAIFVVPLRLDIARVSIRRVVQGVLALAGLFVFAIALVWSFLISVVSGLTPQLWLASVVAGCIPTWIFAAAVKRRARGTEPRPVN